MTARGILLRIVFTLATVAVPANGEAPADDPFSAMPRGYVFAIRRRLPPAETTPRPLEFRIGNDPREVYVDEQGNHRLWNGCLETLRAGKYSLRLQATWPGTAYFTTVTSVKPVEAKGACHLRIRRGTQVVAEFRTPFLWGVPCTAQGVFTSRLPANEAVCVDAWVSGDVGPMSQAIGNVVEENGVEHSYPYPFAFLSFLEER